MAQRATEVSVELLSHCPQVDTATFSIRHNG